MKVSQINSTNVNFKGFLAINNVQKVEKKSYKEISKLVLNTSEIYRITPLKVEDTRNIGVEIITKFKETFRIPTHDSKNIKILFSSFVSKLNEAEKNGYAEFY